MPVHIVGLAAGPERSLPLFWRVLVRVWSSFPDVAGFGIVVIIWSEHPSLWYAARQESGGLFPEFDFITSGILFNQLQICPGLNIFSDFRDLSTPFPSLGCYIDFSSFSASRVICAQDLFLYSTCVTVDTLVHPLSQAHRRMMTLNNGSFWQHVQPQAAQVEPKQQSSRESIHGADI